MEVLKNNKKTKQSNKKKVFRCKRKTLIIEEKRAIVRR